jgi:hypothetical protein
MLLDERPQGWMMHILQQGMQSHLRQLLLVPPERAILLWQQAGMARLQARPDRPQDVGENDGRAGHAQALCIGDLTQAERMPWTEAESSADTCPHPRIVDVFPQQNPQHAFASL